MLEAKRLQYAIMGPSLGSDCPEGSVGRRSRGTPPEEEEPAGREEVTIEENKKKDGRW